MSTTWIGDRKPDRYVPGFGGATHAIYSPVGTPKPREECQPFTFELYTEGLHGREPDAKGQEKFLKQLATLTKKQEREAKRRAKAAACDA